KVAPSTKHSAAKAILIATIVRQEYTQETLEALIYILKGNPADLCQSNLTSGILKLMAARETELLPEELDVMLRMLKSPEAHQITPQYDKLFDSKGLALIKPHLKTVKKVEENLGLLVEYSF